MEKVIKCRTLLQGIVRCCYSLDKSDFHDLQSGVEHFWLLRLNTQFAILAQKGIAVPSKVQQLTGARNR